MQNGSYIRSIRRWWESVDNLGIALILSIMIVGAILITTASPAVAERLKISSFYFVYRQLAYLIVGLFLIFSISFLEMKVLKRVILLSFIVFLAMLIMVLFVGEEVKGSKRWLNLLAISLQPSELIKPFYIVICGLLLSEKYNKPNFPGFSICILVHLGMVTLLILQPDFGMVITYTIVLAGQFFLAGLSLWWISVVAIVGIIGAYGAYNFLPHVARRVDSFLNPEVSENYQVEKSLEAYVNGKILGKGPGEGTVKAYLPDSHTDFIFSVAGEEFGAIVSSLIMLLYFALILRCTVLLIRETNLFKIFAGSGLIMLFALQTIFNIGVTLHLLPTKGMTLPFISYGGSSTLCFAITFGILLNLTKKQYGMKLFKEKTLPMSLIRNS